jgi:hypothetical protein
MGPNRRKHIQVVMLLFGDKYESSMIPFLFFLKGVAGPDPIVNHELL